MFKKGRTKDQGKHCGNSCVLGTCRSSLCWPQGCYACNRPKNHVSIRVGSWQSILKSSMLSCRISTSSQSFCMRWGGVRYTSFRFQRHINWHLEVVLVLGWWISSTLRGNFPLSQWSNIIPVPSISLSKAGILWIPKYQISNIKYQWISLDQMAKCSKKLSFKAWSQSKS